MYSPNHVELDRMINQAWADYQAGDKATIDHIYKLLMSFSLRVCSKTCGRYVWDNDEEASIARIAILEALEKYQPDKGSFLVFLGQVIRNRIIDYKRKEKKQGFIPFSFLSRNGNSLSESIEDGYFEDIIDDLARKQEIDDLKEILLEFDISFEELVQLSPRQPRSRQNAQKIVSLIVENEGLSEYLMERKLLPMKELETEWQVNRKIADRYRKYIITSVLITLYDFPYLQSYLQSTQGVNKHGS